MSSAYDSDVYAFRNRAPFTAPQITAFMTSMEGNVRLTSHDRHSVASRRWWTLEWEENGKQYSTSAQTWDLCLWRAIYRHKLNVREAELEQYVSKGAGWNSSTLRGWIDGDGI